MWSSVHDLRGGIERAAAERLKKLVLVVEVGQTEICNLEGKRESEQNPFYYPQEDRDGKLSKNLI